MIINHRHIPIEIQIEIIKRINDLKSLIQLRSVSKAFKSLIDSKDFIAAHTTFLIRHPDTQHHRLLLRYADLDDSDTKYISFSDDDDDSFRHDENVIVFPPDSVPFFHHHLKLVGSSHGLFCFYDCQITKIAVIWNPSVRKSVAITLPNLLSSLEYMNCVGFGVCPRTLDPKLVKINYIPHWKYFENSSCSIPYPVEVFTLSSGVWRSLLSSNLPRKSVRFGCSQAVIDGFIYWDASLVTIEDGKISCCKLVMSFDLTSEEFGELYLPDDLAHKRDIELKVSKLRDSLGIIEISLSTDIYYCAVWMMTGNGYSRSFNRLFTISSPDTPVPTVLGFTKSGTPVIEIDDDEDSSKLSVYEPCSQHTNDIGIYGIEGLFFLNMYMETLLLLDQ